MTQVEKEKWYGLVKEYCEAHVFEIGTETTEKWISILCDKRIVNFKDYYEDQLVFKTKKEEAEFDKYFKETWKTTLLEYQKALKKAKSEEAKEELMKNGVKRKPQTTETKTKKRKK